MSELKNILSHSACLSQKQMLQYLEQDMAREEVFLVEEHISDCMFCNDALDGLALLPKDEINTLLLEIEEHTANKFNEHTAEENKKTGLVGHKGGQRKKSWIAAAGVLLLIFGGGAALFSYFNDFHQQEIKLATEHSGKESKGGEYKKEAIPEDSRELSNIALNEEEAGEDKMDKNIDSKSNKKPSYAKNNREENSIKHRTNTAARKRLILDDNNLNKTSNPSIASQTENEILNAPNPVKEIKKEKAIIAQQESAKLQEDMSVMNTATMPKYKGKMGNSKTGADAVYNDNGNDKVITNKDDRSASTSFKVDGMELKKKSKKAVPLNTYQQGMFEYNNGNYKKSIRLFKKALRKKDARNVDQTKYYLALALQKSGNTKEAQTLFKELATQGPYKKTAEKMLTK